MYTSQGASENYCASMDIDMSTEQTWQNWINLEACTPEVDGSSVFGNEYQQPVNGLNYDYPEFIPGAQYAADVCTTPAMEYPISWASSISTFRGSTASSPVSSSSSTSTSPSCSPNVSQSTRNLDVDELTSVNTNGIISSSRLQPPLPPPLIEPISESLRKGKRSSSRRAVPYEVHSPKKLSPVQVNQHPTPPRRSLRPRDAQKYCKFTPYLSEDDDDTLYTSDDDFGYVSELSRRGALSLQPQARILHQIQRDTSVTSCPICEKDFSRHADVIRHYLSVHYIKSDDEILNDTSDKRLHCLGCTKILSRKDSRERHEAVCPIFCAQRGVVPNPVRPMENPRKQRARNSKTSCC